jgi:hypothetical protein
MYDVIDVIHCKAEWLSHHPELTQTEGVRLTGDVRFGTGKSPIQLCAVVRLRLLP